MSTVKIVYWSGTGNTEAMAQAVANGAKNAGADAELIPVGSASVADLASAKAFALGCPSMGAEQLEEGEMEPFMADLEGSLGGKNVGLFGSYGWGNQEWMRDWEERCKGAGATVVNDEGIAFLGAPDDATISDLEALGAALAGLA
ncbi:MAG: flavodoxin [Lachnospiraceae bacterium]|nr:flavodoxin [Lachnospiraceae bacterium]